MSGQNDPRLLFSLSGIRAYHLQNGHEDSLTPSGPQTLSLLMVPTSSPFADPSTAHGQPHEEDFYLHLNLPPELDLPLPATTQIYHQPPNSYLIPRWDLGPESGAFTRIEFPPLGSGPGYVSQEDIDTFETILAQCTAFLERAQPPHSEKGGAALKGYNPADYKPGEAYVPGTGKAAAGHIVLIDEENGSVVGELGEGANVIEDPGLKPGSKNPVEIQISEDGQNVSVRPVDEDYLSMANHPAYKGSSMVQNAAAASRLIVTGSSYLSNAMSSSASTFTTKTKPNQKPLTFKPATQTNIRKINTFTTGVANFSGKTVGSLSKYAQNMGASMAHKGEKKSKAYDKDGNPVDTYKPGILNKSMIAFSTIADGIAYSGKNLLTSSGAAASQMIGHRYGAEAGGLAADVAGGVKNVGLVYIDVTGVSRRAVIKSVAKGMVVGKVKGGGEVVVGGGDGGAVPEETIAATHMQGGITNDNMGQGQTPGSGAPGVGVVGYGNAAPPSYSSGVGEPLGSQGLQGQVVPPKQ